MSLTTWEVTLDLDGSGSYATDITEYVWRFDSLRISGRGRRADLGAASPATLTLSLDNGDGRFSPKNTGGAYYDTFHPYAGIRVRATYNAITYDLFKGIITGIDVKPHINDALVYITAADFMWALERTSIRLPLMEDHHPGVIIDRLLDYAEIGEHVDNPIFKDDLTGWSNIATGVLTRATTGPILEGLAAGNVVTAAAGDGARYALPHAADSEFRSVKVQATVYLENNGGTLGDVILRIVDSATDPIASSAATTLTDGWQRITVNGTFGAGATDFYLDVEQSGVGARTFRIGALHVVTFGKSYERSIEVGVPTLERVFFHETSALSAIQEVALNELGGLFYFDGAGVATFEERTHRWAASRSLTSQVTIDERFKELGYNEDAQDRIGEVILSYPIWEKAATEETIASVAPLPRAIPPNGTLRVEIDFGGTARDIVKPVANTDYFINANPGGGGADESGNVTLAWDTFGGGAQAIFTNTVARTVHLIAPFQVRGKPVRREDGSSPARATPTTVVPYAAVLSYGFALNAEGAHMRSWADYLAARYGDTQRENLGISVADPFGDMPLTGLTAAMLGAKVSDRITLTNDSMPTSTKVNADFYIDSLDLAIAGQEIAANWRLVPVDAAMFTWDSSSWDGPDVWGP